MPRRRKTLGTSFSWKRATGMSAAKGRLSRQIGVPLTRSGRRQKMGRALGCVFPFALIGVVTLGALSATIAWAVS